MILKWHIHIYVLSIPLLAIANLFSGEELYGKFLDLYANHTAYNNLKLVKRLGYLQYLDVLMALDNGLHAELDKKIRFSKDYEACVWPICHVQPF